MTLQAEFAKSRGRPVQVGGYSVVQMDRIPITRGTVTVTFEQGNADLVCGVALKSAKGSILLPNGERVPLLHIWDEPGVSRTAPYEVDCKDGELRVWNIYRVQHASGLVTEDSWTGNAGMVVEHTGENRRRYRCSCGSGDFDPENQRVSIEWTPE